MIPPSETAALHVFATGLDARACERPLTPLQIRCAWCRRMLINGLYTPAQPEPGRPISDGICPECHDRVFPACKEGA